MTIDELKRRINEIDTSLQIDVDLEDEPWNVWYETPSHKYFRIFELNPRKRTFTPDSSNISEINHLLGDENIKNVAKLLYMYFDQKSDPVIKKQPDFCTQKDVDSILNEQSTMKNKEQIKRDFIDYLLDHGISYEVDNSPSNIEGINIKNKTGSKVCFIDFTNDKVKQVVVQRAGQVDEKELARLVSLYEQILEMIDGLKHAKEHEDD